MKITNIIIARPSIRGTPRPHISRHIRYILLHFLFRREGDGAVEIGGSVDSAEFGRGEHVCESGESDEGEVSA